MAKGPKGGAVKDPSTLPSRSYHPNESLAKAIVRAWTDATFKKNLLTFGDKDDRAIWPDADRSPIYGRVSKVLQEFGISLDKPVVFSTEAQLANYDYTKAEAGEVYFVLPRADISRTPTLGTAVVAMSLCAMGI
jgi:hypothetical protein